VKAINKAYNHNFTGLLKLSDHTAMLWDEPHIMEYYDEILVEIGDSIDPEESAHLAAKICREMASEPIRILFAGFNEGKPAGWLIDTEEHFRPYPYPVGMPDWGDGKYGVFSDRARCYITPPKVTQG